MDGGELLLGAVEVAGQGGRGVAGVGDEQPGAADRGGGVGAVVAAEPPGGQGGGEPAADLGQELRQAGRGERQLAEQPVGVGGLFQAVAAEGGVVQGADRSGRGAGQGQGLVRGVSHGRLLPGLPSPPVPPGAADEEPVGDLLAQGLVVAVAEGGQVVDPGRGRLGAGLPVRGAGLGVAVPSDDERDGGPGRLPGEADLDPVQVERGEQQLDHPPGQPRVDLVDVAVQADQGRLVGLAPLGPQERLPQQGRLGDGPLFRRGLLPPGGRGLAGLGVDRPVVGGLQPGLEQAVHLRQVRDPLPVAGLDQELLPHSPEKTFDFPSSLWFPGPGVDELDAQDGAAAQQPRVDEGRAVVQVGGLRDAAGLQGRAERRGHPDHVVVMRPAGAHHGPGVVVDEREKIRLLPADHRPVERVSRPHLVRPGALEPAEGPLLLLRPRGRPVQLQPLEQPLQGPVRRRPPGRDLQDPPDLRRRPPRLLPLQRLRQRQHLLRGPRRRLPRRRHQRVEPALLIPAPPPGQRRVRHRDPPPARPLVDTAGQLPGPPAPLRLAQPRLQELLHQRVPEQARLPGPLHPRFLIRLVRSRHALSLLGCLLLQARRE